MSLAYLLSTTITQIGREFLALFTGLYISVTGINIIEYTLRSNISRYMYLQFIDHGKDVLVVTW